MYRKTKIIYAFAIIAILTSCSNNDFVDKAKETTHKDEENRKQLELEQLEKENNQMYKEMEKPLEEVIQENDLEQVEILKDKTPNDGTQSFTDANEFAKYVGKKIYDFQSLKITPREYYEFLKRFVARKSPQAETLSDKESSLLIYANVQSLYEDKPLPQSYELSTVKQKHPKEGYFYRKVSTPSSTQYYITTIVKEEGIWKFSEDSPAPPFKIKDSLKEGE